MMRLIGQTELGSELRKEIMRKMRLIVHTELETELRKGEKEKDETDWSDRTVIRTEKGYKVR